MHFHRKVYNKLYRRVKYARGHLPREQYIAILAQPLWRRTQRTNLHTVTDPYGISAGALKCRPSKRIKLLSRPLTVRQKYHPELLIETRKFAAKNKAMSEVINEMLSTVRASRYQKYHVICNAVKQRAASGKKKSTIITHRPFRPEEWQRHLKNLEKLAAPKIIPRPRSIVKRKKWRPVNNKRLEILALPVMKESPYIKDPTKVTPSALTYKITPYLEGLAVRKRPLQVWVPRMPGIVSAAALKAVATPRIINLAEPQIRPPGLETDLKENAFAVSPSALKAKCSKRILALAKPKTYGK